jgi:hypothetical protein
MDSRPLRARRTASIAATAAVAMALAVTASASASTYYVSPSGSDTGPGSAASPWRTLAHVRAVSLAPGARVLLRRGATWREQLVMERSGTRANPIVIGAFGSGPAPRITASDCVKIKGDFVVVQGLAVDNCTRAGVTVQGDHVLVRGMWTTHNIAGIEVDDTSSGSRVTHNVVAANNRMNRNTPGGSDDHGAFGILLHGDYTTPPRTTTAVTAPPSRSSARDGIAFTPTSRSTTKPSRSSATADRSTTSTRRTSCAHGSPRRPSSSPLERCSAPRPSTTPWS